MEANIIPYMYYVNYVSIGIWRLNVVVDACTADAIGCTAGAGTINQSARAAL